MTEQCLLLLTQCFRKVYESQIVRWLVDNTYWTSLPIIRELVVVDSVSSVCWKMWQNLQLTTWEKLFFGIRHWLLSKAKLSILTAYQSTLTASPFRESLVAAAALRITCHLTLQAECRGWWDLFGDITELSWRAVPKKREDWATNGKWDPSIPLFFSCRASHACPEA